MASSSHCSSCGQNPCRHLSEELEQLLPCLELSISSPDECRERGKGRAQDWPRPGEAWQEHGSGPDSMPGKSQCALTGRIAFLPTRFPGSTDLLFDSQCFLLTLWMLSSPEHRNSGSSKGLFSVMWGRTMSRVPSPLLLAGAQPRSILRG